MRKLLVLGLALVPAQVEAQERTGRMMLEAGLVGGSGDACPGRYVGIKGRVAGPVSLYGMVRPARAGAAGSFARRFARASSTTAGTFRRLLGRA